MTRSILLVSLSEDDAWVDAITVGLQAQGLELIIVQDGFDHFEAADDDRRVFLAYEISKLDFSDRGERAVVIGASCASTAGRPLDTSALQRISALCADASGWPHDVFVGPDQVNDPVASVAEIELFSSVWIRPPAIGNGSELVSDVSADQVLSFYRRGKPESGQVASWSPRHLTAVSFRGEALDATMPIDLAGPPRPLAKGPYFTLTPGVWKMVCEFTLDEMATRNDLRIEWGPPEKFVSVRSTPKSEGLYRISLTQVWEETGYAELIFELMNGCIGGELHLLDIKVEHVSDLVSTV